MNAVLSLPKRNPMKNRTTRITIWGVTAVIMILLPQLYDSGFAISLLSQIGIMIIFALSYNMLLGQTGLLSFGHAVYSGLGGFFTVHFMNMVGNGEASFPLYLMPIIGGLTGAFFGVLFGYVTTKKSGTTFAMITMGIGEMVFASSQMFSDFFGGEGGIQTDRMIGEYFGGITFGPEIQVYYLIAAWCMVSMIAMFALSQTPLGRMANAVRDNPERVEFIGYNPQRIRFFMLVLSAFFAGIAGALLAINFEIATAENVSAVRSGGVLLATFIGGAGFFFGPILGAIVFVLFAVALSELTHAWLLYLGLFFVLMVMYVPGGIASVLSMQLPLLRTGRFVKMLPSYLFALLSGVVLVSALVLTVEMIYKIKVDGVTGTEMTLMGIPFDALSMTPWMIAAGLWLVGIVALRITFSWVKRSVADVLTLGGEK